MFDFQNWYENDRILIRYISNANRLKIIHLSITVNEDRQKPGAAECLK